MESPQICDESKKEKIKSSIKNAVNMLLMRKHEFKTTKDGTTKRLFRPGLTIHYNTLRVE